jgi:Lipid A 3-O-deacylase (PagL)
MRRLIGLMLLAMAPIAGAMNSQLGVSIGRAMDSHETDVVRLAYRHALGRDEQSWWWWPRQIELGAGIWRLPDLAGRTRRYDVNLTPIWRIEYSLNYFEAGIGLHFLSHTINNNTHRLPSSLQFGSHLGTGLSFDKLTVGVVLQHLSNAGIKKPNGGINFYLLTVHIRL